MKNCKHCGKEVAKGAKTCPNCGGKLGLPTIVKVIILIVIILCCIVGCVSSCTKSVDDAIKETFGSYDDQNGKTTFNVGETFENKHLKIKYVSSNNNFTGYNSYLGPKDGNKIVEFVFDAENIGTEDEDFSYWSFNCYADDVAMDQFYFSDDSSLTNSLSSGKKATQKVYCEVPKSSTKVTVEYKPILAEKNYEFIA